MNSKCGAQSKRRSDDVAAVSHVMSADDEMTVWEVSRFLYKRFAKEKRHCNFSRKLTHTITDDCWIK